MQVPLQIAVRNLRHSKTLDERVQRKVAKLERFHPRITSCRVAIEKVSRQHQKGNTYSVRIDIRVPDRDIVINREEDPHIYVAMREAFNAAERKLEDFARVRRHEVKRHEEPARRTIT
jgi:ribosomal subunit interface protein